MKDVFPTVEFPNKNIVIAFVTSKLSFWFILIGFFNCIVLNCLNESLFNVIFILFIKFSKFSNVNNEISYNLIYE